MRVTKTYMIARTDSSDFDIALERVVEYSEMGADAVLIEAHNFSCSNSLNKKRHK